MKNNLFEYLKSTMQDEDILNFIKYRINEKIYYYGDHFKATKKESKLKFWIISFIKYIYVLSINVVCKQKGNSQLGLSSAYDNVDKLLNDKGYQIHRLPTSLKKGQTTFGDWEIFWMSVKIEYAFKYKNFSYLTSKPFFNLIKTYHVILLKKIKQRNYKFLLIPNDTDFSPRLFIKIFRELDLPTILMSHGGIPSMYDKVIDNGTDYIVMRNKKEVESFTKMGYVRKKFFITGHPFYNTPPKLFKFNFDDILVITKSINGVCPLDQPHLEDRGNIIMYLFAIQNTLVKLGISEVRLRPHPSENADWYMSFLDKNFFQLDKETLIESLLKATLVIGPTSTTIIDAMAHSVNYTIFEPTIDGKLITGFPITPPLDGSDPRIPIARNEEELLEILKNRKCIDISVYKEFADPNFDISFMKKILDDWYK